ncbi:MAG: type II secretion system F family protein [bacterium]|nr:type II secretion system F family protein [bacterium]
MAQYTYKARTSDGKETQGSIEASSIDLAVSSLQRRNFLVTSIVPVEDQGGIMGFLSSLGLFAAVNQKDIVILSRQLATLFSAKVPIAESFKILVGETENPGLRRILINVLDDIQGGLPMSQSMAKHPDAFSKFYVAMVRSGEEAGKMEEIFDFLASYLERNYDLASKAKNALIYPAFVFGVFITVMVLMLIYVIPPIASLLKETGQALPFYTVIVINISDIMRRFGIIVLLFLAAFTVFLLRYGQTEAGKIYFAKVKLSLPVLGTIFKKIYLARIADNLHTLISGGITVVRALEITSEVVGNEIYKRIMLDALEAVKGGSMISEAFAKYEAIPPLLSQMIKIGEATGKLDYILGSVSRFYTREVSNLVDNMVNLIEPLLIIFLGLGVGFLAVAILLPIYSISAGF